MAQVEESPAEVQENTKRKSRFGRIVGIIVVLVLLACGYALWLHLSRIESTDYAEVDGDVYAISSRISGHAIDVKVEDEQEV